MTATSMPIPEVKWGDIGYITYKRTYARKKKDGSTEEFHETVDRELKGIHKQLKLELTDNEIELYKHMRFNMKGSVAGRFMWQLGTQTVNKLGLSSLMNCAFVVIDEPIRPFTWAMDNLMLGSGVGYSIKREHVYKLPKLQRRKIKIERWDDKQADFIVPDTREGWVKLLGKVLKAYFYSGKGFTYSMQLIRGRGEPIKGFGGVASGPGVYEDGLNEICNILDKRRGKQLKPIDCLDIMNIIGQIVVAGNVRRSAQLAMGDYDDLEFLKAKRWDLGSIPNWRAMSNNSVDVHDVKDLPDEFWQTYQQGEPYGLINMELSREVGRLGETQYPDTDAHGYNPCQPDFATVIIKGKGLSTFKNLEIGDEIWSKSGWTTVTNKWGTGIKSVYEYRTTSGVFIGTDNHKVDTRIGKVEVDSADSILGIAGEYGDYDSSDIQSVMDGMFFGDGYYKCKDREISYPLLIIGRGDQDYFDSEISHLIKNKFQGSGSREDFEVETTITVDEKPYTYDLRLPKRFFKNKTKLASFLRGLYTANGSVVLNKGNSCRITYKTASRGLAEDVQLALSYLGIISYITTNKAKKVTFYNGEYLCKESYDINITSDRLHFATSIGFIQKYKMDKLNSNMGKVINRDLYTSVKERTFLGEFEVYDITVDNQSHTYWTGGLSVSNCAEQSLANHEVCCLAEVFLPNVESKDELIDIVKLLYKINKHSLSIKSHNEETEKIVHKNMRMGIGITGVMMCSEEQLSWLDECYRELREFDKEYSDQMGWSESIKLTTVKPSGTLSLLAGVTPGVHPATAGQYYIRRIRMSADSDLVDVCKAHGYFVEYAKQFDGTDDKTTVVVEFPCKYSADVLSAEDVDVIDQLETVKFMQTNWSDNSVSVTAYYKKEDIERVKDYLKENFKDNFKSLSFLLYSGHGFVQAPYEPITKEQYEYLNSKVIPITSVEIEEDEISEELGACGIGGCPIK